MTLLNVKSKRGRKPLDELERKRKTAISLAPDVIEKLNLEVNKSLLINTLLKNYYFSTSLVEHQQEKLELERENQKLLDHRRALRVEVKELKQKLSDIIEKFLT